MRNDIGYCTYEAPTLSTSGP